MVLAQSPYQVVLEQLFGAGKNIANEQIAKICANPGWQSDDDKIPEWILC